MTKIRTHLKKNVHVCDSFKDFEKHFVTDVESMSKEFQKIVEDNFDSRNPYDQAVLIAIATNILACVEVNAELDDCNMVKYIKTLFYETLENYRQLPKNNEQ